MSTSTVLEESAEGETPEAEKQDRYLRQARWRERNPLKVWAHNAVRSGLRRGLIERQACENCGDPATNAHHVDYERPLAVRWLCRVCHKREHARMKRESRV